MWIIFNKDKRAIVGLTADCEIDLDLDKQTAISEVVSGLIKPDKIDDYDAIQVTDRDKAFEYMQAYPMKLVLAGTKSKPTVSIREPEIFSLYVTTDAPDQHPVDGIPEIPADGKSSALITVQKIDERSKIQKGADDNDQLYLRVDHGILRDINGEKDINSIKLDKGVSKFRLFSQTLKRVANIEILSEKPDLINTSLRIEFI